MPQKRTLPRRTSHRRAASRPELATEQRRIARRYSLHGWRSLAISIPPPAGDGAIGPYRTAVKSADRDRRPAGHHRYRLVRAARHHRAAKCPLEHPTHVLPVITAAGVLRCPAKRALIEPTLPSLPKWASTMWLSSTHPVGQAGSGSSVAVDCVESSDAQANTPRTSSCDRIDSLAPPGRQRPVGRSQRCRRSPGAPQRCRSIQRTSSATAPAPGWQAQAPPSRQSMR